LPYGFPFRWPETGEKGCSVSREEANCLLVLHTSYIIKKNPEIATGTDKNVEEEGTIGTDFQGEVKGSSWETAKIMISEKCWEKKKRGRGPHPWEK